jgi:hypothetical protein
MMLIISKFQCLCWIRLVEIMNSTLQLKVQCLFQVECLQAKGSTDKFVNFVSLSEGDSQCSFEAIIALYYYNSTIILIILAIIRIIRKNKNGVTVAGEYS